MRVLSIDFDYFQEASQEQLKAYPDGIDLNTELSELTWGVRYAFQPELIESVGIRKDELDLLYKILACQNTKIPVMIANSHVHAYHFIHSLVPETEKLMLCNVDMHHDMQNENPNLDCGNWVKHIMDEYTLKFRWICNPATKEMYGFNRNHRSEAEAMNLIPESLADIKEKRFDAVFLCRSDNWTPPHLDKYFTELWFFLTKHFDNIKAEHGITEPRTQYLELARTLKEGYTHQPSSWEVRTIEDDTAYGMGLRRIGSSFLKTESSEEMEL